MTPRAAAVEPHPYRAFEHAGWQTAAARYASSFAHATAAYVDALLDAAEAGPGCRLLDVACGSGVVATAALARGADAAGVDFSPAMLAEARRRLPGVEFHEADAEALPMASDSVDAVVSNFGLHHFPFPSRALAEARRVLRPGGRLAATVWAPAETNPAWRIVFDAVAAHGDPAIALPTAPFGRLNRAEDCVRVVRDAGFAAERVAVRVVPASWPLAAPGDLIDGFQAGTVRMAGLIAAQTPEAQSKIRAAVAAAVGAHARSGSYAVPTAAILVSAVR